MQHKRMEMWVNDRTGEINVLVCEPLFGAVPQLTVPLFDDCEQKLVLNNGEIRIEVVVYNKKLELELIKETARKVLAGNYRAW